MTLREHSVRVVDFPHFHRDSIEVVDLFRFCLLEKLHFLVGIAPASEFHAFNLTLFVLTQTDSETYASKHFEPIALVFNEHSSMQLAIQRASEIVAP